MTRFANSRSDRGQSRKLLLCLSAGLSLAGCATGGQPRIATLSTAMHDGGVVMPPQGWLDYCSRNPNDASCRAVPLTADRVQQLKDTQAAILALPAADDLSRFGKVEFWQAADERGGDCEDFALAARARLLALGWPLSALRLATAWTEQHEFHLVLTVDVVAGGQVGTLVVDRRFPTVQSWQSLQKLGYRFETRQAAIGAAWVRVDTRPTELAPRAPVITAANTIPHNQLGVAAAPAVHAGSLQRVAAATAAVGVAMNQPARVPAVTQEVSVAGAHWAMTNVESGSAGWQSYRPFAVPPAMSGQPFAFAPIDPLPAVYASCWQGKAGDGACFAQFHPVRADQPVNP